MENVPGVFSGQRQEKVPDKKRYRESFLDKYPD